MSRLFATLRDSRHLLAPLTAHCRDFHESWTAAPSTDGGLSGRWEGEWRSLESGHQGPLRCVMTRLDDSRWQARFHARYGGIFRACYATELHVERRGEGWVFQGSSDLGWIAGGAYAYDGEATIHEFVSRYRSPTDHGEFRMKRVQGIP